MKRVNIKINGIVQGVGFRPFIHKLVMQYKIKGWVKNTSRGVVIEAEGKEETLINFIHDIESKPPVLSQIESISTTFYERLKEYKDFKIIKSTQDREKFTLISPDIGICDDCKSELFDYKDRRYRFPFINCTNCGPRFTIIKDIPYDREKTTMSNFPMCSRCREEYEDINDRRYHAQPDCCYECGPELFYKNNEGIKEEYAIDTAVSCIKFGGILAVKGIGGVHLTCDAYNEEAARKLRRRKLRDEKPFAIMCRDMETVEKWCYVNEDEKKLLLSHRKPIVLLRRKSTSLSYISMDNNYLGVMLPYTPVHCLLMEYFDTLVMTSGNISDLPIIYKNDEAIMQLKDVADGFLLHNRDIHVRCDDSLLRIFEGREYPIRRSRGYVPFPIKVGRKIGDCLACGGEQKASFALTRDDYVFLSQHIGDLKNIETLEHYEVQIEHFKRLFSIMPSIVACDLHPDYMSTNYAEETAKREGTPLIYVQHHHAHMASCMADNNIFNDVIGIIWDGTGYGTDGTIWGGEFLVGGYEGFKRLGSIRTIDLPGGDRAVKNIYRVGYSLISNTLGYIPDDYKATSDWKDILCMMEVGLNCPRASSIGRLFDGVAAILGLRSRVSYEGQGAVILESTAAEIDDAYNFNIYDDNGLMIYDWRSMIESIIEDKINKIDNKIIAAKFMNSLVDMSVRMSSSIRKRSKLNDIVLSGGVFQNIYLLKKMKQRLEAEDFNVYVHNRVSTNDEGISLGQSMIAAYGGGKYVSGSTTKD